MVFIKPAMFPKFLNIVRLGSSMIAFRLFSYLQLHPTVVDRDTAKLQIAELLGEAVGPTHGFIEQLRTKQLFEFVFEECAERNA